MIELNSGDRRPIYEQIKERFKNLIISGALRENERIPSVRELASSLAINPNTIQKAYKDLETEGYIYSLKAKGSFVSPGAVKASKKDILHIKQNLLPIVRELEFLGVSCEELCEDIKKIYKEGKL